MDENKLHLVVISTFLNIAFNTSFNMNVGNK